MIKFFRSVLVLFCFGIFGAGACIINFLLFPSAKIFIKKEKLNDFYSETIHKVWRFFTNFLIFTGVMKLNIKDRKEIEQIKNKIIVSTHPSFIDVVILIGLIPRTTCIAKEALARNPIMKNILNTIFITNEANLEEFQKQTKELLDEGFNVIIFPSGIRHRRNEFPKIKKGAALIALNAKRNIVPLKLYTDFDFLFIHQPVWQAGEKPVVFSLEKCPEINVLTEIQKHDSEIIIKKNITKLIENSLYN